MQSTDTRPAIRSLQASALLFATALCAGSVQAGGIMLYEAGHEGSGLANAGAAVLANDPSVLMSNPAGLMELEGTQISANGQLILGDISFSRDANNQFDGNEGGNILQYLPGASFFISHRINEKASIGFGMYGNFGLAVDFDDDWAGRYFTQESAIIGISLQPTYAYKVNDDLSIGFGPRLIYGYYRTEVAVNNNLLGLADRPDGQLEYKDTDVGVGFNIGALYRLNERTKLGLAYTSKVDLEFEDRPSLDDISNPLLNAALRRLQVDALKLDMEVPQTVVASASYELNSEWRLLASLGWQDWSEFGNIGVEVDANAAGVDRSVDREYKDTWHLSLGAQYQASPRLRWNMGVGYDSSAVDDDDRTVDNPMNETWRLAAGVNYALDDGLDLHLAYTLVWLGDMDVSQTKQRSGQTLSGGFDNSSLHILGGGATWRF